MKLTLERFASDADSTTVVKMAIGVVAALALAGLGVYVREMT